MQPVNLKHDISWSSASQQWWRTDRHRLLCIQLQLQLQSFTLKQLFSEEHVHIGKVMHRTLPLNLRGLIWLLMMVWSKRGNINTAAQVTIAECNTLVVRCSRQLIGPADWVYCHTGTLTLWLAWTRLPTISLVHIVTQWSGSGGTEAYLSGQLASFSALTLLVGSSGL